MKYAASSAGLEDSARQSVLRLADAERIARDDLHL
jgi:hypothetical protein